MDNPIRFTDPDGMGSYDSEGQWHSEMEGFYNYHNFSSAYRPKSFRQDSFRESNGSGGSGPGPKISTRPGIIERIGNFFSNLFRGKKSTAAGHTVKATITGFALIPEGVAEGSIFSSYKVLERVCFLRQVLQQELYSSLR